MSDRQQLLGMGFSEDRVDWALKATSNRGLQPAMDHILENDDKPVPDLATLSAATAPAAAADIGEEDDEDAAAIRAALGKSTAEVSAAPGPAGDSSGEAKSIKCSECGKVFKNVDLANYHAEKSGHASFEESTEEIQPLSETEKKQRLEDLRAKMAEKRARKAADDAKEDRANELLRRKAGQDQAQAKDDLLIKQLAKEAEAKKREKVEEARAKAAVKAQIEADKKARAEKTAKEKALREGREWTDAGAGPAPSAAAATSTSSGVKSADYKDTRLQIRYSGGSPITLTLPSDQTLQHVAEALAAQNVPIPIDSMNFATTFPRKTFSAADFNKSLKELGLTPSAALQLS